MVAEEQAARAARLRALREAAQLDTPDQTAPPSADGDAEPVLKFRNYVVKDDKISHEKQAVANPPKYEAPTAAPDLEAEGEVRPDTCTFSVHDALDNSPLFHAGTIAACCAEETKLGLEEGCGAQACQT